jgi:hypothetical protein
MSLSFLHTKSWHTGNQKLQASVWAQEQDAKNADAKAREREEEVRAEREEMEMERAVYGEEAAKRREVGWMYQQPKDKEGKKVSSVVKGSRLKDLNGFVEGSGDVYDEADDPAVRDFKLMLAGREPAGRGEEREERSGPVEIE